MFYRIIPFTDRLKLGARTFLNILNSSQYTHEITEQTTPYTTAQYDAFYSSLADIVFNTPYIGATRKFPASFAQMAQISSGYTYREGQLHVSRKITLDELEQLYALAKGKKYWELQVQKYYQESQPQFPIFKRFCIEIQKLTQASFAEAWYYQNNSLRYQFLTGSERIIDITGLLSGVGSVWGMGLELYEAGLSRHDILAETQMSEADLQSIFADCTATWDGDYIHLIRPYATVVAHVRAIADSNQYPQFTKKINEVLKCIYPKSSFLDLIQGPQLRVISSPEDRIASVKSFKSPLTEEGRAVRETAFSKVLALFSYDTVTQVQLMQGERFRGFIGFLHTGKFSKRVESDLKAIADRLMGLMLAREQAEAARQLAAPVVLIDPVMNYNNEITDFRVISGSPVFTDSYTQVDARGLAAFIADLHNPQSALFKKINEAVRKNISEPFELHYPDEHTARLTVSQLFSGDIAVVLHDTTAETRAAKYDVLTGLFNRRSYDEELIRAVAMARREKVPFMVAYFDVNKLKVINDSFGHDYGDALLCKAAQVLKPQDHFRVEDVVARYGGDEITCIYMGVSNEMQAQSLMQHVIQRAQAAHIALPNGKQWQLSLSVGLALYTAETDTFKVPEDCAKYLLKSADAASYRAKHLQAHVAIAAHDGGLIFDQDNPLTESVNYYAFASAAEALNDELDAVIAIPAADVE